MTIVYQEGPDKDTGVSTKVHDLDSKVVIEKTYDAEPFLEDAAAQRAATAGEKWGEMRKIGHVPMAVCAEFYRQDGYLDPWRMWKWLMDNPKMATFEKALQGAPTKPE